MTEPKIGRPQIIDSNGVPTRQRILDAALEAIVEKGYDGATLSDIARVAEVSAPAIYNHFESRGSLFVQAVRSALSDGPPDSFLRQNPRDLLDLDPPSDLRQGRRLLVELHTAALRHEDLKAALAEWQESHIQRWIAEGRTEASARAYYVLVQGLALMPSLHIARDDAGVAAFITEFGDVLFGAD